MDKFLWLILLLFTPFLKTADGGGSCTSKTSTHHLTSFRADSPELTYDPGLGSRAYFPSVLGGMEADELLIHTLQRAEQNDTHKREPHEPVRFKIADRSQAATRIINGITQVKDIARLQTLLGLLKKADPEFQEAGLISHIHADPLCNLLNDKLQIFIRSLNTWVTEHDKETSALLPDDLVQQFESAQYLATLIHPDFVHKDFAACRRGVESLLPKKESVKEDALPHEPSDGKIHSAHSEHVKSTALAAASGESASTKPVSEQPAFPDPKDAHGAQSVPEKQSHLLQAVRGFGRGRRK